MCWGAIIGDIVGSRFEFDNHLSKDFELFTAECEYTDDSVMTVAVMDAILTLKSSKKTYHPLGIRELFASSYRRWYEKEPNHDYGLGFVEWLKKPSPAYNSFGNGACMRVSPCAYYSDGIRNRKLAVAATEVSHNHPIAIAWADWLVDTITQLEYFKHKYHEDRLLDLLRESYSMMVPEFMQPTLDDLRGSYVFDETCQGTLPVAIQAVLEASDFEDALRNAVSVGGDTDTLCASTGSIAEPIFGINTSLIRKARTYLSGDMLNVISRFEGGVCG